MKIQIVQPWSNGMMVGEPETHFGVTFHVAETSKTSTTLVVDLPDDEARAMIDANRATACEVEPKRQKRG